jgi:neutral amino acid transport system permease protein
VRRLVLAATAAVLACLAFAVPAGAQDATPTPTPTATDDPAPGKPSVRANLTHDGKPVQGVEITVKKEDGTEVGRGVTDAQGEFALPLPGPGRYTATLNKDTLPKGVQPRDPSRTTLTFSVRTSGPRALLFPLGEAVGGGTTGRFERFLQLLVEGIKLGLIIGISAVGLSLIFGTTGLTNFAHGELVTFGAIATWFFNITVGMHLIPAAILGILIGAAFGGVLDLGLWRPLRRRRTGLIAMLVVTIGLALLMRYIFLYQFGGRNRPYADYQIQTGIGVGPISIVPKDLVSIAISLLVLVGVATMLTKSKIGKAIRAVADNGDLASSSGIDVDRVILAVWVSGGALAALGGVLIGLGEQVNFQSGFFLLLLMFAGVTLGGLGTAYGALLGSLIVGILVQVSTLWIPTELKNVGALLVLIVILLIKPQGLLGRAERIG